MPRSIPDTRLNRKVTEFFTRKSKMGPRPGQTVHEISSSEQHSVISISSDEASSISKPSQLMGTCELARLWDQDSASSTVASVASSAVSSSSASEPLVSETAPQSTELFKSPKALINCPSKSTSKVSTPLSTKNNKKRKQQPVSLITSGESDDSVTPLPTIHVSPSRKGEQRESSMRRSISQAVEDFRVSTSPAPTPLAPLQNLQSPENSAQFNPNVVVPMPSKPIPHPSKKATIPKSHKPSPPKRARLSPTKEKLAAYTPGCDADDEQEHNDATRASPWPADPNPEANVFLDDRIDMDTELAPRSAIQVQQETHSSASGDQIVSKSPQVLPSSQAAEVELRIEHDIPEGDASNADKIDLSLPLQPSPSKARAIGIIARIKANAEAQAAAQAQEEQRRSLLGLTDNNSGLSDVSNILTSESDESDLELELDTFVKPKDTKPTSSSSAHATAASNGASTRRSTRHLSTRVKLDLLRDSSHDPIKTKAKAKNSCPLDILLKDNRVEAARKARVETKRTNAVAPEDSDLSSDFSDSVDPETPRRKCGRTSRASQIQRNSSFTLTEGDGSDDLLMGDEAREVLLGKKDAEAVGKILEKDRRKRVVVKVVEEHGFRFWSGSKDMMADDDVFTSLQIEPIEYSNAFVAVLNRFLERKDYQKASALIDSGVLISVVPSVQVLKWLYISALSPSEPNVSLSAYRSLLTLLRGTRTHSNKTSNAPRLQFKLVAGDLLLPLAKIGTNDQFAQSLFHCVRGLVSVISTSLNVKTTIVARFVVIVEELGRSNTIDTSAIPTIVSILLLLALDISTSPEVKHNIASAIESILNIPNITRDIEFGIYTLVNRMIASLSLPFSTQAEMLSIFSGCTPVSGRIRRWIAWLMLNSGGGNDGGIPVLTLEAYTSTNLPPIDPIVNIFHKDAPGPLKLQVDLGTDYMILEAQVHILAVVLTDVEGYVRGGDAGMLKGSEAIQKVVQGLEKVMGRIVDTRAAHLDRTRTKDAINRLHKRVIHQRRMALDAVRKTTGKVDQFFVPVAKGTSKVVTAVSRKPTPTGGLRAKVHQ